MMYIHTMDIAAIIPHLDFANHHPNATTEDIKFICDQVTQHGFNAAFMNPSWVLRARQEWGYTGKIGTIVSFSLGQDTIKMKSECAVEYAKLGADELDIMCNVSYIKEANWKLLLDDMETTVEIIRSTKPDTIIKFVPECGYLTADEIKKTAELMVQVGADFFKTCTGMGPRGANLDDVRYIKEAVGDAIKIKVAGGVDTREEAESYLTAGVERMGTSKALEIIATNPPSNPSPSPINE